MLRARNFSHFQFFMSLPQPSKLCAKKEYFKNISISQEICNERLSKADSLRADYLNSAYDDKFEHLLNKDSDFDIDCSLRVLLNTARNYKVLHGITRYF